MGVVYRLIAAADWRAAQAAGEVAPGADDRRDGYMHLSTPAQVMETARLHYADVEDLMALEIDEAALGAALKYELAPRRGEAFPHLYAPLPAAAVRRAARLEKDPGGAFRFKDKDPV